MTDSVTIRGKTLTFPIQVRAGSAWAATFLVPVEAAQAVVDPTGLQVMPFGRKSAAVVIQFVNFIDTDLQSYREVGINYLVRPHDAPSDARAPSKLLELIRARYCLYVHQLPVTKTFSMEAGRMIWGFPKFIADISLLDEGHHEVCELSEGGTHVLTLQVKNGSMFHLKRTTPPTYTFLDGVRRCTEWEMPGVKVGARLGGAELTLGNHPIAEELRALGLPKKAFMTQTIPSMRARFHAPVFL